VADFYAARDRTTPPLLWPSIGFVAQIG